MDEPLKKTDTSVINQLTADEKEELHQKIQFDQCKIYHYLVKFGVPSNAMAGFAYVFSNYNQTNASSLIFWYSALMIANLVNLMWALYYNCFNMTHQNMQIARRGSIFIVAVISLIWGSIGILFFSDENIQHTTTLIFLSGALICFAITTVIDLTIGTICIISIVVPNILYSIYLTFFDHPGLNGANYLSMSFSVVFAIVGVFLMLACYIGNKVFVRVSMLGYINALLSQKLENINSSLEQRIKRRTQELEYSNSLTHATLESTQEGILAVNLDGVILTYNNKFLKQWGITEKFLLSKKIDHIFKTLADKVDNPDYFLKKVNSKKQTKRHEIVEFRLKSGVVLEYYTHSQFLHKKIVGTIHGFQDITERNRMRMQASLQDRLATTGKLVANVAHEVNNPIAWILSNLQLIKQQFKELLQKDKPSGETCLSYVSKLEEVVTDSIEGAERIQEIVLMFKKFGRIDEEETSPINVHGILNTAISMAMIQVNFHIKLEKHLASHQPVIIANSNKLHQVFLNLIINAVQSFPKENNEHQIITISTATEGNMFRVDIKDTGAGIPPELASHIFEPFFTTKSADEGTGLGLSICQDILSTYGGKITVQSEPGKGSTFSVFFPISQATEPPVGAGLSKRD